MVCHLIRCIAITEFSRVYDKLNVCTKKSGNLLKVQRIYAIGLMSKVFANGPEDRGSLPGRVIPKNKKMVFDATFLNIQNYKIRIKGC